MAYSGRGENHGNISRRDLYMKSTEIRFTIEVLNDRIKKLIGTSKNPDDNFRAFAYFKNGCMEEAKTSIYMEHRLRDRDKSYVL